MEVVLSVVVIVAVLAAAVSVVVWLHGRSMEHRLAVMDAVAELSQRVTQLEDRVHRNDLLPLERRLDALGERLAAMDARMAASQAPPAIAAVAGPALHSLAPAERAMEHLTREGFARTRVVGEESFADDVREIRVETSKDNILMKGSVIVARGSIADVRLTPIFELFP
ncbi:MAG: hypothetical protein JNJ88_11250 [Planctomycetes bacterium]|nr:hypothetical protein [Planctomycetota bacterium]